MGRVNWALYKQILLGLLLISMNSLCNADTDVRDVAAMNSLFISLGYPPLQGWILVGGDPCGEKWQGVECVFSNITALQLSGLNLGGELGNSLEQFESIMTLDVSNNHIGGNIPSIMPTTLTNLSLNNNLLTGVIPDDFQLLSLLNYLDLSGNNLTGQLPPSMASLSSLTTLHLQNNQLSGMLDTLQNLPLVDLNIENNLFSGPIPARLLNIPNFRKDGNPFNTTIIPPAPALAPSPHAAAPFALGQPNRQANGTTTALEHPNSDGARSFFSPKLVKWIVIIGIVVLLALVVCLFVSLCLRRNKRRGDAKMAHDGAVTASTYKSSKSSLGVNNDIEKAQKETIPKPLDRDTGDDRRTDMPRLHDRHEAGGKSKPAFSMTSNENNQMEISSMSTDSFPVPPPPPPFFLHPSEEVVKPTLVAGVSSGPPTRRLNSSSLKVFTVALLQEYTDSFSEDNLLGTGTLGSVYKADLPDGKLLAVKKLDSTSSVLQSDDEFHDLISDICKIRHDNIVKLVGYCAEHRQRLLVYEYCKNGTLYDALHVDENMHQRLSWNVRVKIALGAARALEYLHEASQPPIIHRNFKSANILLDDELKVQVSDSGLAPLLLAGSRSQLSGRLLIAHGYSAPEFEMGTYTYQSDVYSFGVVMLELLTGRKSCDRSRARGEQFLVRWAVPRLHDIDALSRMVDPALNGLYPIKSISRFADIISSCIMREPEFRPPISEIVQELLQML